MLLYQNKAAQYVRMSTDMQRYSIQNQTTAIALYALQRGLEIVRSYEDIGKSGLQIGRRSGLKQLLSDVVAGNAGFAKILVYDVSRWGRFQDNDESAHYEFICREAGVNVEYCAEQFSNDGSVAATLLKNLKRAMAGEYSRELSAKVFAGQCKIVSQGYRNGSTPGYALRRCLIDEQGIRKMELAPGQRKSITTDRIILVPGPADEVEIVHRVYSMFIDQKRRPQKIADTLNVEKIPSVNGEPWNYNMVRDLLINEKYIGNSVYNRVSQKLGSKPWRNPKHEWIRKIGAFEPIVSQRRFIEANNRIRENAQRYPGNYMLDVLSAIWCQKGRLHLDDIASCPNSPCRKTFEYRFGSLRNAYRLVGYRGHTNHVENLNLRHAMRRDVVNGVIAVGGSVAPLPSSRLILVNKEFTVALGVARELKEGQHNNWRFSYKSREKPDVLIIGRIGHDLKIKDYYVLPYYYLPNATWLTVSGLNYRRLESFRATSLTGFLTLCARKGLIDAKK